MEMLKNDIASLALCLFDVEFSALGCKNPDNDWMEAKRHTTFFGCHLTVTQIFTIKTVILLYEREKIMFPKIKLSFS